jgi:hypothetical protein
MAEPPLYSPARHDTLGGERWSDARAETALAGLVADLEGSFGGPAVLWPNHRGDLEGDPDLPFRTLYMGAGGIVWALARLSRTGHADPQLDLAALAPALLTGWRAEPEFASLYPAHQPSLLMGEAGLLALCDALAPDPARRDALVACIDRNAENPTLELLWGSPGTMLVAVDSARATGDARFVASFRASASWLLEQWTGEVWEQHLYDARSRLIGPGHGFAGNVHALLRGRHLLDPAVAVAIERRAVAVLASTAQRDGALVQWPDTLGRVTPPEKRRTQWCHGAPGMVIALGDLLGAGDVIDELLVGAGELTWRAGPLRASAGLCHGTAGNAYAFLRLARRTGDERWLERARAFAMHAVAQSGVLRRESGPRHTLFSGDAGVALLVAACLDADACFPVLDDVRP